MGRQNWIHSLVAILAASSLKLKPDFISIALSVQVHTAKEELFNQFLVQRTYTEEGKQFSIEYYTYTLKVN